MEATHDVAKELFFSASLENEIEGNQPMEVVTDLFLTVNRP